MEIYVAICLDIDRDAAFPIKGVSHGVCLPYHGLNTINWKDPNVFTIKGTLLGLKELLSIFNASNLPFNCFIEASIIERIFEKFPDFKSIKKNLNCDIGLHGLYHEDISGEETGISFSRTQEQRIVDQAVNMFENLFEISPIGYRSPYLKISEYTHQILIEKKVTYDSSIIFSSDFIPQIQFNKIPIIPILRYETNSKPFISYLWTLFEGIRSLEEVLSIYKEIIKKTHNLGNNVKPDVPFILTLNLHPWHLAYSVKQRQYLEGSEFRNNVNSFKKILEMLKHDKEVSFVRISDLIARRGQ